MSSIQLIKNKPLLIIILFSLIVRLVFMLVYPDQHFPDAVAYSTMGEEIFSGKLITNNIYMPLYPIWSYITGGGVIHTVMDICISVASIWLIYTLSFYIFKNKMTALLSAVVSSIYPHFIFYSVSGLTEIFYTFLLLLSFLLFYKKFFFWAIFILVMSILVRPTLDLFNPILVAIFIGVVHKKKLVDVIKYTGVYFILYAVILSPWWAHQYIKYGEFVRLNLGDGIVLYSGNNPMNKTGGGVGRSDGLSDMDLSKFNHIEDKILRNKAMKDAAFEYILSNPVHFIKMSGVKFLRFWRVWPYTKHYQQWYVITASILSYGVVLFLSIGFLLRNAKKHFRKVFPIFSLIGYLTLVHMVTIGSIRYRFPLEPFLIIFASYFLVGSVKKYRWFDKVKRSLEAVN